MPGGKQNKFACERDEGVRGIPVGGPRVSPPSNQFRRLTARASAALAFIAALNALRSFPRRRDVARFLDLPNKRQSEHVVDQLIRNRYVACTARGLEIA